MPRSRPFQNAAPLHRTVDVPQADRLMNVRRLAAAAREGIHHPATLFELLDVDERHFAYYRQAAEILGIIRKARDGALVLSDLGSALLATREGSDEERRVFREAIQGARALKPFRSFFDGEELGLEELANRLQVLTGLSETTARRRARTLTQWRRYIAAAAQVSGPALPDLTPQIDEIIANHNALAKQRYLDWVLTMDPAAFERLIASLFVAMGHVDVRVTGQSGDGGVDVEATRKGTWGPELVIVQVKRYSKPLGRKYVDELVGVLARRRAAAALLITSSDFTPPAVDAAKEAPHVSLVNGPQLVRLLAENSVGLRLGKFGEICVADERAHKP